MANVLDQADDCEFRGIDVGEVRNLASTFKLLNSGVAASPEEEASADQLAAIRYKVEHDVVPYADFAVLRPHGNRLAKAMRFTAKVWTPELNAYTNKEVPGPSSFEEWRRS